MRSRILFNGVEYDGVEQMPPEARAAYERTLRMIGQDKDGNGIPDVLEGKLPRIGSALEQFTTTTSTTHINVNGQEYSSPDEMPPDVRRLYEEAISRAILPGGGGGGGGGKSTTFEVTFNGRPVFSTRKTGSQSSGTGVRVSGLTLLIGAALGAALMLLVFWLAR